MTLTASAHAAILDAAAKAHPLECCGLLVGPEGIVRNALAARNVAADPAQAFEIDPAALVAAHRAARADRDAQVLGYFHSHPNGLARPSSRDAASAAGDGRIWAIAAAGSVTLWRDLPSGFAALSYAVADG
ncbi:Mov34/MPN/PAD-1 family protein [Novosphingobium huizhouense]|uniref:Mov34/MPN/PAD-1 family protein n=1 Tax=Novosphingobium huizhouense TaxID=2866625 RepID=UPI001CD843E5|nr:Mov34/MPN/PAD-1 family protein [Novosphingobium huizhouense]